MSRYPYPQCRILWAQNNRRHSLVFDVTNAIECENAELQLQQLHDLDLPYSIRGALFQGHGFPLAATAMVQPDTMHGANV